MRYNSHNNLGIRNKFRGNFGKGHNMENEITKIEIATTIYGQKVFKEASENIAFYAEHIDKILAYHSIIDKIEGISSKVLNENYKELKKQLDFSCLLSISSLDLSVIVKHGFVSTVKSEQLFYVKQGYLLMHSILRHYDKKFNKYFKELINDSHPELLPEFKSISLSLKAFKANHKFDTEITNIRNSIAGHIDDDLIRYYNTITSINHEKAFKTMSEFINLISSLQSISSRLISIYKIKLHRNKTK